jgi:death-on-curing protein
VTGSTEFLEFDDLVELVRRLLGDSPPIRDVGLLESAVARPRATAFGETPTETSGPRRPPFSNPS